MEKRQSQWVFRGWHEVAGNTHPRKYHTRVIQAMDTEPSDGIPNHAFFAEGNGNSEKLTFVHIAVGGEMRKSYHGLSLSLLCLNNSMNV